MKKQLILIMLGVLFINLSFSQIYFETSATGLHLQRGGAISLGYGYSFSGGYSFFHQKLDVGLRHDLLTEINIINVYSTGLEVLYKPFKWEYFKPYVGGFIFRFKEVLNPRFIPNFDGDDIGYSLAGIAGIQFKSDLADGLFIDIFYSYRHLTKQYSQSFSAQTIGVGVKYYFNFMKKE